MAMQSSPLMPCRRLQICRTALWRPPWRSLHLSRHIACLSFHLQCAAMREDTRVRVYSKNQHNHEYRIASIAPSGVASKSSGSIGWRFPELLGIQSSLRGSPPVSVSGSKAAKSSGRLKSPQADDTTSVEAEATVTWKSSSEESP